MMHPGDMSLAGKAAVVTGAGAGIGAAIARGFANFGASAGVLDKNGPAAERVAASIRESGGKALAVTADVNEPRDVAEAASRELSERGSVDILVNNVGDFLQQVRPFLETDEDDWTALFDINLRQVFRCVKAFAPSKCANITRLQVYGAPEIRAVRVSVEPDTPWVFSFSPLHS